MVETVGRQFLQYTGKVQPQSGEKGANGQRLYPYLPSSELVEAVNLAIYLERPLLLKGEPGCGKTLLANAVAYELSLNLEAWYVKSTSRARDGLYTYDAVGRLRDAQLAASFRSTPEQIERIENPSTYVRWGPLGRAFQQEKPTVVLIDEIDKADIDFPNDLLLELDQKRFIVEETGDEINAKVAPIVLITSNDEKDLPDAFLRRCLFHYVEFPDYERLKEIIYRVFADVSPELVDKAVLRFMELRKFIADSRGDVSKNVSTSELIDWFKVLQRHPQDEILKQLDGKLPFLGVLLKNWAAHQRYLATMKN
ncbi:MAG: AAA family ATPase [Trichormus sp.]